MVEYKAKCEMRIQFVALKKKIKKNSFSSNPLGLIPPLSGIRIYNSHICLVAKQVHSSVIHMQKSKLPVSHYLEILEYFKLSS